MHQAGMPDIAEPVPVPDALVRLLHHDLGQQILCP